MKNIAILGCGAIGTQIAAAIDSGEIEGKLTQVYDQDKETAKKLVEKLRHKPTIVENFHLLSTGPVDVVVEAASQQAVKDVALSVLQNRKDLMIMSVGALLDEPILEVLSDACKEFKKTIYLPSGAIAGLDAIKSVKNELDSVSITTTKHPRSLKGAKFFETSDIIPDNISQKTTIFEGSASEAVPLFPANINVAALLSLSGIGSEKTRVRIVADPTTDKNTHHIEVAGSFGRMIIMVENTPDQNNPKTSRLAILSAIEKLRTICSNDIQIGT